MPFLKLYTTNFIRALSCRAYLEMSGGQQGFKAHHDTSAELLGKQYFEMMEPFFEDNEETERVEQVVGQARLIWSLLRSHMISLRRGADHNVIEPSTLGTSTQ